MTSELGDGFHRLRGRGRRADNFRFESSQDLKLHRRDDGQGISLTHVTPDVAQDEQIPGDDGFRAECSEQGLSAFMLQIAVDRARFQGFKILFDLPAGPVPVDDLPTGLSGVNRLVRDEKPAHRLLSMGRRDFQNLDDVHLEASWSLLSRHMVWPSELDRFRPKFQSRLSGSPNRMTLFCLAFGPRRQKHIALVFRPWGFVKGLSKGALVATPRAVTYVSITYHAYDEAVAADDHGKERTIVVPFTVHDMDDLMDRAEPVFCCLDSLHPCYEIGYLLELTNLNPLGNKR